MDTPKPCAQCEQLSRCSDFKLPIETVYAIMTTMDDTMNPKIISGLYNLQGDEGHLLLKTLSDQYDHCSEQRLQVI